MSAAPSSANHHALRYTPFGSAKSRSVASASPFEPSGSSVGRYVASVSAMPKVASGIGVAEAGGGAAVSVGPTTATMTKAVGVGRLTRAGSAAMSGAHEARRREQRRRQQKAGGRGQEAGDCMSEWIIPD